MTEYMFVYGTLRNDSNSPMAHIIDAYCECIGDASMPGLLYDLGRYPGMLLSDKKEASVKGQCFKLLNPKLVLAAFDYYEECSDDFPDPKMYLRKRRECRLQDGRLVDAWVYVYNHPIDEHMRILSGDYLEHLKSNKGV